MLAEVEAHYKQMEENGIPKYHTHVLDPIGVSFSTSYGPLIPFSNFSRKIRILTLAPNYMCGEFIWSFDGSSSTRIGYRLK